MHTEEPKNSGLIEFWASLGADLQIFQHLISKLCILVTIHSQSLG